MLLRCLHMNTSLWEPLKASYWWESNSSKYWSIGHYAGQTNTQNPEYHETVPDFQQHILQGQWNILAFVQANQIK